MLANEKGKKIKNAEKGLKQCLKMPVIKSLLIVFVGTIFIAGLFCFIVTPEKHDLKVGQIAPKTITATKEVVDEVTTVKNRELAAKNTESSYHQVENVKDEVAKNFDALFKKLYLVQAYGEELLSKKNHNEGFTTQELEKAKKMLEEIPLSDFQISILLNTTTENLDVAYNEGNITLQASYNSTIRGDRINESIQNIQRLLSAKVDTALLLNVVTPLLREIIEPNFVIDEEGTAQVKENAMELIEPVIYTQGQNIVVAGERVELNQYEMLKTLGLINDNNLDIKNYYGVVLLTFMMMGCGIILLWLMKPSIILVPKNTLIYTLVIIITLITTVLFSKINRNLIPVYMGGLLLASLLGTKVGIVANILLSLFVGLVPGGGGVTFSSEMVKILLTSVVGGTLAIYMLKGKAQRVRVLLCGFYGGISNVVMILAIGLISNNNMMAVFKNGLTYASGAIIGSVLSLAIQPVFEQIFNVATQSKLLELANPKQPLLRRLLLEAPGTYYHSIVVANLAEAAADAIGANGVLARAGAYFHDVGKLKRPAYFKENQLGENPHDKLDPYMSATIIMAHARDGLVLTKQYRLPEEIQNITVEHHGNTFVGYFYHKAKEEAKDGEEINIDDFRYDGMKPSSKESAIIMLADTVEAAVRSMQEPTKENIRKFIGELVRGKISDGQLTESPLTLKDIDDICESFILVLSGVYHERIEYPTEEVRKIKKTEKGQNKNSEMPLDSTDSKGEKDDKN